MDLPIRLDASFAEGFEEPLPVRVIAEDGFAPVPAIQDACPAVASERRRMVNRAFILNPQRSWHGATMPKPSVCVNGED